MKTKALLLALLVGLACLAGLSGANHPDESQPFSERLYSFTEAEWQAAYPNEQARVQLQQSYRWTQERIRAFWRENTERKRQALVAWQNTQRQHMELLNEAKWERKQLPRRPTLAQLEARVTNLEHALAAKLSHTGVPSHLHVLFDAKEIRQLAQSKAEIQRAVHNRILNAVLPLWDASTSAPE